MALFTLRRLERINNSPHSTTPLLVKNYFESKSDAAEEVELTWEVFVKRGILVLKPLNWLAR